MTNGSDERTRSDQAVERAMSFIRASIRDGRLTPGERVVEREVASQLNTSRGPVREAIQLLVQQGLLVRSRQRSARVKILSKAEVLDFLEVWGAVGPLLYRLVAERIRIRDNMERVLLELRAMRRTWPRRQADPREHQKSGERFMDVMLEVAGNPLLRRIIFSLNPDIYLGSIGRVSGPGANEYVAHLDAIEKAFVDGTPDDVEEKVRELLAFLARWVREDYPPETDTDA